MNGLSRREFLDILQLPRNGPRPPPRIVNRVARLLKFLLGFFQNVSELAEFGLHRSEERPDLARPLLDGQRPEPQLEAVEECGECRRPRDENLEFPLNPVGKAGTPEDFSIQTLRRKKHDGKIGGVRRVDIFFVDGPRFHFHPVLHLAAGFLHEGGIRLVLRIEEPLVILLRKFGIDRKPHRLQGVFVASGQLDGKLHSVGAPRLGGNVGGILILGLPPRFRAT